LILLDTIDSILQIKEKAVKNRIGFLDKSYKDIQDTERSYVFREKWK